MTSSTPSPRSAKHHSALVRPVARAVEVDAWELTDLVTRLRRVLRSSIRTDFPWETLPMAQVEILQRLAEEPGLRVSDLARRHRLAANTVSNLIQQMVLTGLVARAEKPGDRRSVTLQLTETGAASLAGWQAANERRLNGALSALSASDRTRIAAVLPALSRLVTQLEATDIAATGTPQLALPAGEASA